MHFLLLKNTHVAVAVYHGCLFVLLACSTWLKGLYINSCFLFLVGLFVCFSWFLGHLCISNFATFVVAVFLVTTYPRFTRFSAVLACCLLVTRLWDSVRV